MTKQPSTTDKLLSLFFTNAKGKPILFDADSIARNWGLSKKQLLRALKTLRDSGRIKRTDAEGNPIKHGERLEHALLRMLLTNGGSLPYNRPRKRKIASELGTTVKCLLTTVQKLRDNNVVYSQNKVLCVYNLPIVEVVYFIDTKNTEKHVKQAHFGTHYYQYAKGFTYGPKKKPPVYPHKKLRHRILEDLVANGGEIWRKQLEWAKLLKCTKTGVQDAIYRLRDEGVVDYDAPTLRISNPAKAKEMLAPWEGQYGPIVQTPHLSFPKTFPFGRKEVGIRKVFEVNDVSNLETANIVKKALVFLFVRKLAEGYWIQAELDKMRVRFPLDYEKGLAKIMAKFKQQQAHVEVTEEEARRIRGQWWGKQRAIVVSVLNSLQSLFPLPGGMDDKLVSLAARELRGVLPSEELPDQTRAEDMAAWVEEDLPADDRCMAWLAEFIQYSDSAFMSDFVSRGGLTLLLHMQAYATTPDGVPAQRYAFHTLLYIGQIRSRPFDIEHPEWFAKPDGMLSTIGDDDSIWGRQALSIALHEYLDAGFKLGSLNGIAPKIVKLLHERYPVETLADGLEFTTAWDCLIDEAKKHGDDEMLDELLLWDIKHYENDATPAMVKIPKYSLAWYQSKLAGAKDYGAPADVTALQLKISALKEWDMEMTSDDKRHKLVSVLNRPTRYDDPRLAYEQWDWLVDWPSEKEWPTEVEIPEMTVHESGMRIVNLNGNGDAPTNE
ncbi:hypothetical protein KKE60_05110 [Patescibacteria group bacterium]|nr:hypothetical protein [Patescibacteria group bacterium]